MNKGGPAGTPTRSGVPAARLIIFIHMNINSILIFLASILLFSFEPKAANVKDYGAKGDGIQDDTRAITDAIAACRDGILLFPAGRYRISRTIEIDLSRHGPMGITSPGGSGTVVMEATGPAFRIKGTHTGSALPASADRQVWLRERMFTVENIAIEGANPAADGIELQLLMQPVVRGCLIRKVRHGVLLTRRNRNVLIEGSHIYDCDGVGIYLDSVNIHQMIISHSHISYCRQAGILVRSGEIRNFQVTGNDIEYNCAPGLTGSADICIDLTEGGSVREGTITSNTIQAIESAGGANIRFTGDPLHPHKLGLWSITGNHISNQQTGISLQHTQGISITGNTFVRAYVRHLVVDNSRNIAFSGNVIDHNPDYFTPGVKASGGIRVTASRDILLHDNIVDGISAAPGAQAAVEITNSRNISLKNSYITSIGLPGVMVTDSPRTMLEGNLVDNTERNIPAVSIKGDCSGSEITGNRLSGNRIEKGNARVKGNR